MFPANFKPKTTAAASRGSLATARLSCYHSDENCGQCSCNFSLRMNHSDIAAGLKEKIKRKHRAKLHDDSVYRRCLREL